jgi:hypothetical protein
MFTKSIPELKEERYWIFIDSKGAPSIAKVKTIRRWYDKTSKTNITEVDVIENIFGGFHKGMRLNIDFPWQLQKTLEDAMKVMILAIFSSRGADSFFWNEAPWE